jgi:hypothetical protein
VAYQPPKTIKTVLDKIHTHDYVLPAIQREFVWKPVQIARLFDSLMRGYPIGSFLFWQVDREHVRDYRYYDFVREYHELESPHCPPLDVPPDKPVTAVLDGQQRLTALNIGLRGRHAEKLPRKWRTNPDAYPWKYLYLNLLADAPENEEGMVYDFRFLTPEKASEFEEGRCWFRASKIMDLAAGPDLLEHLRGLGLEGDALSVAFRRASELHTLVHVKPTIHYYLEEEQEIERVLDIFIRVNSGGTVLSYSDLLLSIATAQWETRPAREVIHGLVDQLNKIRLGFDFSKDFVLKAGLMLADIASVGFRVTNFTRDNMLVLEEKWPRIERALKLTVQLVADFGFSDQTLSADSALLPIAYYLYHRDASEAYLTRDSERADREAIRGWLIRSLLKSGIWGSGLDTTLTALRAVIKEHGADRFPLEEIEAEMARRGRSLRFDEEEIQDLVDVSYGDRRTFSLLALLYPFVDLRNQFHVDHIFPRDAFRKRALRKLELSDEDIDLLQVRKDGLPNLQLLEGAINQAKQDRSPHEWLARHVPDEAARTEYMRRHDLPDLPEDLRGFNAFYEERRERMAERLRRLLGVERPAERQRDTVRT